MKVKLPGDDKVPYDPKWFRFSQTFDRRWKFIDGDLKNEVDIPFDSESLVSNKFGIYTKPGWDRISRTINE